MSTTPTAKRRTQLRRLSVIAPLAGLACLYLIRLLLLQIWSMAAVDAATGALMLVGVLGCSWVVFRVIDRQDRALAAQHHELQHRYETQRRLRAQTEALHQAALAIASERTPDQTLQRLVDLARDLIGAHDATLSVLRQEGGIDDVYTSGAVQEEQAPVIRPADVADQRAHGGFDPDKAESQPYYPPPRTRLSVPVIHGGHMVVGHLALTEKVSAREFSAEDEALLTDVAGHIAVVIQNARLTEQVRLLAVRAERDRISTDVQDGMIQTIYAVNLELENASEDVEEHPAAVRQRLDEAIERLCAVIEDIRCSILGVPTARAVPRTLSGAEVYVEQGSHPITGHVADHHGWPTHDGVSKIESRL